MLNEQLKRCARFFAPENLAQLDLTYDIDPREAALVVVDVQRKYCDPKTGRGNKETLRVSEKIGRVLPTFRQAGLPVYLLYFNHAAQKKHEVDFFNITPTKGDIAVHKYSDSAFASGHFAKRIAKAGHRRLLVCGFNLNACVLSTALDARARGYEVDLLRDLSGNDRYNPEDPRRDIQHMTQKGVRLVQSAHVLMALTENRAPASKIAA